MNSKFINIHAHIFTVGHAPDYFLQTVIPNRDLAEFVQRLLQKNGTRWIIHFIKFFIGKEKRGLLEKYIGFLEIGVSSTQEEVFQKVSSSYVKYGDYGIVVLAQDLDTLDLEDTSSTHKKVKTQIQEILELKRNAAYQKHIFPFLPVDPRTSFTLSVQNWLKTYINPDSGFCGIKIYPGSGFYPFDKRLEPMWEWAEVNNVPIMTHCTRVGSFYLGSQQSITNTGGFHVESINPQSPVMPAIINRINLTMQNDSIRKNNVMWCNVFGNPQCYEPVLEKYPNLKICFAHLGGSTEVIRSVGNKPLNGYPAGLANENWYTEVLRLMKTYKNVYSDISYTLNDDEAMQIIAFEFSQQNYNDGFGKPMIEKLMYGTDFYMTQTEKEGTEPLLQNNFTEHFKTPGQVKLMAYENTYQFLQNEIYQVL